MASLLAAARKGVARQSGVLRIALPPFVASKLIGLLVPMLTAWVRGPGAGLPSGSALLQPFALWDGGAFTEIAQHGYPSGPLNLTVGAAGHLWAYFPGYPPSSPASW
jgi:hypothetical protein